MGWKRKGYGEGGGRVPCSTRVKEKRLSVATDSVRDSTKEKQTKKLIHKICYVWAEFEKSGYVIVFAHIFVGKYGKANTLSTLIPASGGGEEREERGKASKDRTHEAKGAFILYILYVCESAVSKVRAVGLGAMVTECEGKKKDGPFCDAISPLFFKKGI